MRAIVWDGTAAVVRDDVEVRDPEPHEVEVRIVNAGLCHSDVSVIDGTIPFPTPVVLGHEGAGVVERVGAAVTQVKEGDHVVLTTLGNCGQCAACDRGQPTHCRQTFGRLPRPFTVAGEKAFQFANTGVFAERTVVNQTQAIVIDDDVPLDVRVPHRLRGGDRRRCGAQPGQGRHGPDRRRDRRRRHRIERGSRFGDRGRRPHRRRRHEPRQGVGRPPVRRHRLRRQRRRGEGAAAQRRRLRVRVRRPPGADPVRDRPARLGRQRRPPRRAQARHRGVVRGEHALQRQVDPRLPVRRHAAAPRHPDARRAVQGGPAEARRARHPDLSRSRTSSRRSTTSTTASSPAACLLSKES